MGGHSRAGVDRAQVSMSPQLSLLRAGFASGGILSAVSSLELSGPASILQDLSGDDERWMAEALKVAMGNNGISNPNPVVGCVFVQNGTRVAEGATECWGARHAERVAIERSDSITRLAGCAAYVTLEPCAHKGRQPPCADLLATLGLQRCVVGVRDPNRLVNGAGIARLRAAGVEVTTGVLAPEIAAWHSPFLLRHLLGRTVFAGLWALSSESPAGASGDPPRRAIGQQARAYANWLRRKYDAVLVDSQTALSAGAEIAQGIRVGSSGRPPIVLVFDPDAQLLKARIKRKTDRQAARPTEAPFVFLVKRTSIEGLEPSLIADDQLVVVLPDCRDSGAAIAAALAHHDTTLRAGRPIESVLIESSSHLLMSFGRCGLLDIVHAFVDSAGTDDDILRSCSDIAFNNGEPLPLLAKIQLGKDCLLEFLAGIARPCCYAEPRLTGYGDDH